MSYKAEQLGAVLIAEIGSMITRVTLVDTVDGETRVIGRAETTSSIEPPVNDGLYAVLVALAQISEATGRQLLRDGQLLMPQTTERDGINHVLVITSAAGELKLVITAIARDVSARSALHASRCTYATVLQTVTLDDNVGHVTAPGEMSWIERQVQELLQLTPDAVMITGGLEQGAVDAVNRLAHIVGLTSQRVKIDAFGLQSQDVKARPVVYAGNSGARERVIEALSDKAEIFVVDNVRPALEQEQLEGARRELSRLYDRLVLPGLPGMASIRRLSRVPVSTVCNAQGLITRFLAERAQRGVLSIDIGSASSSVFFAAPGRYHPAVLGANGTGFGLSAVLAKRGLRQIARWLPFPISEAELTQRLLNRLLRPQILPTNRDDLHMEYALTREALQLTLDALYDEVPAPNYDWVVLGGGVLAHAPHPALALLCLLDVLRPAEQAGAMLDVSLDTMSMLAACGAMAALSVDGAVTLFDRDLLRNMPLATVVVPHGMRPGEQAVEASLSIVGGRTITRTVRGGEITSLPLPQGKRAQLTLRPASGVRVGQSQAGAELRTDLDTVRGSALGVVIDARGRPLSLPERDTERMALLWEWLVALGAERGPSPYASRTVVLEPPAPAASAPAAPAAAPAPGKRVALDQLRAAEQPATSEVATGAGAGKRISLAELAAQEQAAQEPPPAPSGPMNDMAKLRQTVETPQKKGLFGRKK
jgi:hypothetical protein